MCSRQKTAAMMKDYQATFSQLIQESLHGAVETVCLSSAQE